MCLNGLFFSDLLETEDLLVAKNLAQPLKELNVDIILPVCQSTIWTAMALLGSSFLRYLFNDLINVLPSLIS